MIIQVLSEDDSILSMVDSNLYRERISYSGKILLLPVWLILFVLSIILYLILFTGVFVDTALDMTRQIILAMDTWFEGLIAD